jgi:hypothetical protein
VALALVHSLILPGDPRPVGRLECLVEAGWCPEDPMETEETLP